MFGVCFLCCFSVVFGSLGGLVVVFVCLVFCLGFFFSVGDFFSFSLAATASLEPTV